ncbi:MAG: DUF808 domain-containing protein [Polyangiaceae bacterium]|nr:DUF808 domain-containing protein [Polyangiaceae bacterium]
MAGSSLFALIDDIATILDDVAVMTKVATKKTAGVLGDDLALNAEQVTGVKADRELPVVWAVAKGSLINKAILIPAALLISAISSVLVTILLMIGGAFLCFEGFEKVFHKLLHSKEEDAAHHKQLVAALSDPNVDLVALEKQKIKGAVRTDFVLSAEIIVITLGTVATQAFSQKLSVLVAISLIMTVGVYGLVAGIVKLDDAGLALNKKGGSSAALGKAILAGAPYLMKGLSIAGTVAMFLVGGAIVGHGVPPVHHLGESIAHAASGVNGALGWLASTLFEGALGVVVGGLCVLVFTMVKKMLPKKAEPAPAAPAAAKEPREPAA